MFGLFLIFFTVVCLRRTKGARKTSAKRTTTDRLTRFCDLPPSLAPNSQHPSTSTSTDCPLEPFWPSSSSPLIVHGGGLGAGAGGGALQVVIGGMVTEYTPTYDFGSLDDSTKNRTASDDCLVEIPPENVSLVRSVSQSETGCLYYY